MNERNASSNRAATCGYLGCAKAYGHLGPCSLSNVPSDPCQCGHDRTDHIYHEGACRPGYVCPERCQQFRPGDAIPNRAPECHAADGRWYVEDGEWKFEADATPNRVWVIVEEDPSHGGAVMGVYASEQSAKDKRAILVRRGFDFERLLIDEWPVNG